MSIREIQAGRVTVHVDQQPLSVKEWKKMLGCSRESLVRAADRVGLRDSSSGISPVSHAEQAFPVSIFPRLIDGFAAAKPDGNGHPHSWATGVETEGNFTLLAPSGKELRYVYPYGYFRQISLQKSVTEWRQQGLDVDKLTIANVYTGITGDDVNAFVATLHKMESSGPQQAYQARITLLDQTNRILLDPEIMANGNLRRRLEEKRAYYQDEVALGIEGFKNHHIIEGVFDPIFAVDGKERILSTFEYELSIAQLPSDIHDRLQKEYDSFTKLDFTQKDDFLYAYHLWTEMESWIREQFATRKDLRETLLYAKHNTKYGDIFYANVEEENEQD